MSDARLHSFDGLHNFRDFGGYVAGNRKLVSGRLFRSANHALASEADLAKLAGLEIGAVIDLRRPEERERQPSRRWEGFAGTVIENDDPDEGVETWSGFMASWDMTPDSFRGFQQRYYAQAPYLPRLLDLFSRYFDTLAAMDGAMVVHCAAGKDRTGLIVALTHKLAGVHDDDIMADYLKTNESGRFEAFGAQWAEMIRQERGRGPTLDTMKVVMSVEPAHLEQSFAMIRERSGSVEAYLRDALGVDAVKRGEIEKRVFG